MNKKQLYIGGLPLFGKITDDTLKLLSWLCTIAFCVLGTFYLMKVINEPPLEIPRPVFIIPGESKKGDIL